jgi:hypothetical protein
LATVLLNYSIILTGVLQRKYFEGSGGDIESLVKNGPPPAATSQNKADESIWAHSARQSAAYQYGGEAQQMQK